MLQYGSYLGTPPPDSDWQCGDQINRSKLRGGGTDDDGDNATPSVSSSPSSAFPSQSTGPTPPRISILYPSVASDCRKPPTELVLPDGTSSNLVYHYLQQVRGGVVYAKDPDKFEALVIEAGAESADDDFINEHVPFYLEEFHAVYERHKGYPISSTNPDIVVLMDPHQRIDRRLQALFGILVELFATLKQLTDDECHTIYAIVTLLTHGMCLAERRDELRLLRPYITFSVMSANLFYAT